jgi:hypothetical protein
MNAWRMPVLAADMVLCDRAQEVRPVFTHALPLLDGWKLEARLSRSPPGPTNPNGVHAVSANASATKPARFLAYFTCDHETPLTVPAP